MAEPQRMEDRLARGRRCIEQMCGMRHDIADIYWDRYEDIMHLNFWLTLPPPKPRSYVRLSFTIREMTDCSTDPRVRERLRSRIHDALTRLFAPREEPDDA